MEANMHVTGYVGTDVDFRSNGVVKSSFRLGCTPRMNKGGEWSDGETTWLTINCFRHLAEHTASSVRKGDPVVVVGKLRTQVWTKDGVQQERMVLEASAIGHDLSRGTSAFRRAERVQSPDDQDNEQTEVSAAGDSEGRQADEEGQSLGEQQAA